MDRKKAAELLPIIQAYAEGKVIQINQSFSGWEDSNEPLFNGDPSVYRIKPESKYRPFANAEECWQEMLKHQPFGWTKINSNDFNIITTINTCVCLNDISISYIDAFDNYTFADGAPFGVKVEE